MSNAEWKRFELFLSTADVGERDWIAFLAFENAIDMATRTAAITNECHDDQTRQREKTALKQSVAGMLYQVLCRVSVGKILSNARGLGCAIRYGLLDPDNALDAIIDAESLEALAERGRHADELNIEGRHDTPVTYHSDSRIS